MYPIYHFIFTIILSGFLYPILGWKLILFWLGSFFVDVDHYWWYIIKFKDLSLKDAYIYGKSKSSCKDTKFHVFHIIEFWILMALWSLFSELAFIIFVGVIFHIVVDLIDMCKRKIWFSRVFTFYGWYYSPSNSTKLKTL